MIYINHLIVIHKVFRSINNLHHRRNDEGVITIKISKP